MDGTRKENGPGADRVPRPLVSELPAGWGLGEGRPAEVLALRYELGRLHSLGLLQALILSLRIADGFGQHLAQLNLGLCGFSLRWLPCVHERYVGMRQRELNPACMSASAHITDSNRTPCHVRELPILLQKSKIEQPQKSRES